MLVVLVRHPDIDIHEFFKRRIHRLAGIGHGAAVHDGVCCGLFITGFDPGNGVGEDFLVFDPGRLEPGDLFLFFLDQGGCPV